MKNYKSICARIEIKQEKIEEVYAWAKELNSRKNEVIMTLRDEGVMIEAVFLDHINTKYYLIYYMHLEDEKKAKNAVEKSLHAIDRYHRLFKENVWIKVNRLKTLIDINKRMS